MPRRVNAKGITFPSNAPSSQGDDTENRSEQARFAGAICTDDGNDVTSTRGKRNPSHDLMCAVACPESIDVQQQDLHLLSPARTTCVQSITHVLPTIDVYALAGYRPDIRPRQEKGEFSDFLRSHQLPCR